MDPYEEIKMRLKPAPETAASPNSGKEGCPACRKQIAQNTFNMTAGGSTYLPEINTSPIGRDVLEVMYGPGGQQTAISPPTPGPQPLTPGPRPPNKDVLEVMYGPGGLQNYSLPVYNPVSRGPDVVDLIHGTNVTLPQVNLSTVQIKNTVEELYGQTPPWPSVPVGGSVGPHGKPNINNPLRPNYLPELPCGKNKDGTYNYFNCDLGEIYLHYTKYLPDPNSLLIWIGDNYRIVYSITVSPNNHNFVISVDTKQYCDDLVKSVWCNNYDPSTDQGKAALKAIWDQFESKLETAIWTDAKNKAYPDDDLIGIKWLIINPLKESIEKSADYFINDIFPEIRNKLTNNVNSCICGGNEPTYCCCPRYDDGWKKSECWCGDELKNLCEDCDTHVDLILPIDAHVYDINGLQGCGFDYRYHGDGGIDTSNIMFSYTIICNSITLDSGWDWLHKLAPYDYDLDRRVISLNLPANENCTIILKTATPCWQCCDIGTNPPIPTKRQRIFTTTIDNFNSSKYNGLGLYDKKNFIDLNQTIDYDMFTENYNIKDSNCICVDC